MALCFPTPLYVVGHSVGDKARRSSWAWGHRSCFRSLSPTRRSRTWCFEANCATILATIERGCCKETRDGGSRTIHSGIAICEDGASQVRAKAVSVPRTARSRRRQSGRWGGPIRPGLLDTHPRPKDGRDSLRPLVIEGRGRRTDVTATGDSQSPPTECHHYPRERSPDGDSDSTRIGLGVVRTARRSGTDTDLCAGRGMGGHQRRRCRRCPRKPPLVDEAAPGSVRKEVSTKLGV